MKHRVWLTAVGLVGLFGLIARVPVVAGGQSAESVERGVLLVVTSTKPRELSKVHWGVFRTADYSYGPGGKLTSVPKNDRVTEEDMGVGQGFNRASFKLKHGEYEIHLRPEKGRPVVERFIVNNASTTVVGLNFTVSPIDDPAERAKTEFITLGPSLSDLDARLSALEKKAR